MTSPQNKIQVISAPETSSTPIDATEAAQLVGYDPTAAEQLIDDQYKLVQENEGGDTRPNYEHPIIRFASVALPLGALGGGALGVWFLIFAPKSNPEATPVASATPTLSLVPNAEGRLKSQLAFQDQQTSLEKPKSTGQAKPKKSQPKSSTKKADEPTKPVPVRRVVTTEPEPPRMVRSFSTPAPAVTQAAPSTKSGLPTKAPDPYAQWNTLAKLGQQQSQLPGLARMPNRTIIASETNSAIPRVQIGMELEFDSSTKSPEILSSPQQIVSHTDSNPQPDSGVPKYPSVPAEVASPTQLQQPEFSPSALPNAPMQVAIGATASAKVVIPAIATENNRERFLLETTQDVIAIDGRIALPKGTLIATEITKVDPQTRLVQQIPIAIVYRNQLGQIQQRPLPANSLAVRGKDGIPLIAQTHQKSDDTTGQDLLVATLSGIEKVGEVINRPQDENVFSSDGFGSTQISRRTSRQPDLLAAALEGALGVTVDRLKQRVNESTNTRQTPVLTIPKDQPVSIVFTSFFEIRR